MVYLIYMTKKMGMTLVEVLIAMVIIAIVAVCGSTYFAFCKRSIISSQSRLMEVNFARDTMERLYTSTTLVPGSNYNDALPAGDLRDRDGGTRTYTVAAQSGNYEVLTVTVNSNR